MKTAAFLSAAAVLVSRVAADVPAIEIKGSKFFYSNNGSEFFLRGVAYQQDYSSNGTTDGSNSYTDPLASGSNCARDIPIMKQLYTNVIRTYAIDPTKDHSECFKLLQDNDIYVISDLSDPTNSINRDDPAWDDTLYTRYTAVIDSLANYTNVIGFFAGNEVSNSANTTAASAFVKAAVRDMKAYIKAKNYRTMGVGYATADVSDIRTQLADYFDCGNSSSSIDFWGYNIYSWCGESTYQQSGYADRVAEFSSYNVPAFFAEYGCNTQGTRIFQEVGTLYGSEMTKVFSGGIVYMYFQESNDYGLVSVSGSSVSKMPDFTNLQTQLAKVTTVTGVNSASYTPTNSAAACPTVNSTWEAEDVLPPTPNADLCSCMDAALTCVPKSSVADSDMGDLFNYICGNSATACAGIEKNATTGTFGAYGMCNSRQQLGWVMNQWYEEQKSAGNTDGCAFSGSATTQSVVTPTGTCSSLIKAAGGKGTGTITGVVPTGTGSSSGSSSSGSSGSGSSSSSGSASGSGNAAAGFSSPSLNLGAIQIGAYLLCAFGSGAAMILL